MKKLLYLLIPVSILLLCTQQSTFKRLITNEVTLLQAGDSLVSTLGYFKLTLLPDKCQLQVSRFQPNSPYSNTINYHYYEPYYTFQPDDKLITKCAYLSLDLNSGDLLTDDKKSYIQLSGPCGKMSFTIDDNAVFRLICLYDDVRMPASEFKYDKSRAYNPFLFSTTELTVTEKSTFSEFLPITNYRGWTLEIHEGTLYISKKKDDQDSSGPMTVTYDFGGFMLNHTGIRDLNGVELPFAAFPNLQFEPKCGYMQILNFTTPFIFKFDEFWPMFTVLDQLGYLLLVVRYPYVDCLNDLGLNQSPYKGCQTWICPTGTYELNGTCVRQCPFPYYSFKKLNRSQCVIVCPEKSFANEQTRTCPCKNTSSSHKCLQDGIPYAGGCYCEKPGKYYDGAGCVSKCPHSKLALVGMGICTDCPLFCDECQLSNDTVNYLKCIKCIAGYVLKDTGCNPVCNNLIGQSVNYPEGNCQKCDDPNCIDCSFSTSFCFTCNSLTVNKGNEFDSYSCDTSCKNITAGYYSPLAFTCMAPSRTQGCRKWVANNFESQGFLTCAECSNGFEYNDICVSDCTTAAQDSQLVNDKNFVCRCRDSGKLRISNICYSIPTCPMNMYPSLGNCQNCDYPCVSCAGSSKDRLCTSCAPGFILSLLGAKPICLLLSSLVSCGNGQYEDFIRCMPKFIHPSQQLCSVNVRNCRMCMFNSLSVCILCSRGYSLFNNGCVQRCPVQTFDYNGICILNHIANPNCSVHSVDSIRSYTKINHNLINTSYAYAYYTANKTIKENNVQGYVMSGWMANNALNDRNLKEFQLSTVTYFIEAVYTCKNCKSGYGFDSKGICKPCQSPCKECVQNHNESCTSCLDETYYLDDRVCRLLYSLCNPGQFRLPSMQCVRQCRTFYINTKKGVNCTDQCPEGQRGILESLNDTYLRCKIMDSELPPLKFTGASYTSKGGTVVFLIPNTRFQTIPVNQGPYLQFQNKRLAAQILDSGSEDQQHFNAVVFWHDFISYFDSNPHFSVTSEVQIGFNQILTKTTRKGSAYLEKVTYRSEINQYYPSPFHSGIIYIGRAVSIILLILNVVFVCNSYDFKVDNILVLLQTQYLMAYKSITADGLFQFRVDIVRGYYLGFGFSHLQFFPNLFRSLVPKYYYQYSPLVYKIINLDSEFIRNVGDTLSAVLVLAFCLLFLLLVSYCLKWKSNNCKFWQPLPFKLGFYCLTQIGILKLSYFAMAQLYHCHIAGRRPYEPAYHSWFYNFSKLFAIAWLCLILAYIILGQFVKHRTLATMYSLKKLAIAAILVFQHYQLLFFFEVIFLLVRLCVQLPYTFYEYLKLYSEELCILLVYLIAILDKQPVSTIVLATILTLGLVGWLCWQAIGLYLKKTHTVVKVKRPDFNKTQASSYKYIDLRGKKEPAPMLSMFSREKQEDSLKK